MQYDCGCNAIYRCEEHMRQFIAKREEWRASGRYSVIMTDDHNDATLYTGLSYDAAKELARLENKAQRHGILFTVARER